MGGVRSGEDEGVSRDMGGMGGGGGVGRARDKVLGKGYVGWGGSVGGGGGGLKGCRGICGGGGIKCWGRDIRDMYVGSGEGGMGVEGVRGICEVSGGVGWRGAG